MYTIEVLKSKLYEVTVTQTELHYNGSITIDEEWMEKANLIPYEKVLVINLNNGERLETYVIKGERGSKIIAMNGGGARKACVGDKLIILSFATVNVNPKMITFDEEFDEEFFSYDEEIQTIPEPTEYNINND